MDPSDLTSQLRAVRALGGIGWSVSPIPPGADITYPFSCPISQTGRILSLHSTMHASSIRQSAWIHRANGQRTQIFEVLDWMQQRTFHYDSVTQNPGPYSGILDVQPGDALEWECHIVNATQNSLRFTNQVLTGEMCNLFGEAVGTTIGCAIP
jgi:hypothetical protein